VTGGLIRFGIAALVVGAASATMYGLAPAKSADGLEPREGQWRIGAQHGDGRVEFQLERRWREESGTGSWSHTCEIRPGELEGITPEQWSDAETPVSFAIERDAGVFRADGRLERGQGSGRFTFEPDPGFLAELQQLGFRGTAQEDLERLCIHDVSLEWLQSFGRQTRAYSLDDMLRFRRHEISADYIAAMKAAGVSDTGVEELVRLKIRRIEPDYVRALTSNGRRRYTTDEIVRLKVNGVTAENIREATSRQHSATVEDIIRLKRRGEL
jgi:hypothetical protein